MRLKHKPWAEDKIKAYPKLITMDATQQKGKWQTRFANQQPIHLEIGTGKGRFITELAKRNPEINFIGMELQSSAIVEALEKSIDLNLPNLQLLNGNAKELTTYFDKGEVSKVLLTFSDPWPKKPHEKRRLTHPNFLERYQEILVEEGALFFKTDNQSLFEYSLVSLNNYGMVFEEVVLDLHNSEYAAENIMTEFEEKFSKKGFRIFQLCARFQ